MIRAWTERSRFSHRGRFWHFEDIVVEPPPAQKPHDGAANVGVT